MKSNPTIRFRELMKKLKQLFKGNRIDDDIFNHPFAIF